MVRVYYFYYIVEFDILILFRIFIVYSWGKWLYFSYSERKTIWLYVTLVLELYRSSEMDWRVFLLSSFGKNLNKFKMICFFSLVPIRIKLSETDVFFMGKILKHSFSFLTTYRTLCIVLVNYVFFTDSISPNLSVVLHMVVDSITLKSF